MSLRAIVQTLGGDLYDRGCRANIPAPGHSASDRSVSLLLQGNRIVVHTFGDGDWRAVLDHLRSLGLIDAAKAPTSTAGRLERDRPVPLTGLERRNAAHRLWEAARALGSTASERYCRRRGITRDLPGQAVFRHLAEAPVAAYRRSAYVRPAFLAAIQLADGAFTAVEVTYLTLTGRRAEDLRLSRKTVGLAPAGCAVRLDPAEPEMLVAEGVFTALSASEAFGLPAWALMSTRNLRAWSPPEGVRSVLIAADRGKDGEASAETLRARLAHAGVAASVALPPALWGDWNEWSVRFGPAAPTA
jgi:putative DNA primase/helicase